VRNGCARRNGPLERNPADFFATGPQDRVGTLLDLLGDPRVRRTAVRRVVLESAVLGRVVGRGDDDPVGQTLLSSPVVREDGVGDDRRRSADPVAVHPHLDAVPRQHLERGAKRRLRERVGVHPEKERARRPRVPPALADRLRHGEDVVLVEGTGQGRASVTGRSEGHPLRRVGQVETFVEIGGDQPRNVDEVPEIGPFPCIRVCPHASLSLRALDGDRVRQNGPGRTPTFRAGTGRARGSR
jgi:hypothetical protein